MTKLTNVDAQRILSVLEDAMERLHLVSLVTPELVSLLTSGTADELVQQLGEDVVKRIVLQSQLERQFDTLTVMPDGSIGSMNDIVDNPDFEDVASLLQKSTKDLFRKLFDNPQVRLLFKTVPDGRSNSTIRFLNVMSELRDLILKRLTTTVEEDKSRQELLEEYIEKEKQANQELRQLQRDLNVVRRDREKAITARTDLITKLKAELQDLKQTTQNKATKLEEESKAREETQRKIFQEKEAQLTAQLKKLHEELDRAQKAHKEEEDHLKKSKSSKQNQVEQWIQKYDREMEAKAEELFTLKAQHDVEKKKLRELEAHFAKVDAEKARLAAEQADFAAVKAEHEKKEKFRHNQAAKIQALYRGVLARREFEKLKKSKKKKGKKGKKGKK